MRMFWCLSINLAVLVGLFTINLATKQFKRSKPQLTFLGDLKDSKKPLYDYPIIRPKINDKNPHAPPPLSVEVTIDPAQLTTPNGFENINIFWVNSNKATDYDWIGIYSPSNSSDHEYLDYFYTDGAQNGSYQARIVNMRDSYQARYFTEDSNNNYILQGISNDASVIEYQPLQGHLSLTNNSPNEMQIRWVSSLVNDAIVEMGTQSGKYTMQYTASYYTYDTTYFCGGTASIISPTQFRDPGYIYTVIADKLEPDTRYYYRFGSQSLMMSDEYTFRTSSSSNTANNINSHSTHSTQESDSFKFIMYGDQGTYTNAYNVISLIENEYLDDLDLLLHIGDISYAWGNGYTWEIWSNMVSKIASSVPYMISVGNHEYDHTSDCNNGENDLSGISGTGYHPTWGNEGDDSNGECGAPTYYRYDAPLNGNSIFWYSFDYNSVHFVMLSSEHNYTDGTDGYKWLENDLKHCKDGDNGVNIEWIVVNIHRPLYESEIYASDNLVNENLVKILEPTLFKYNVDLVLAGHYHAYERVCAVYNYTCIGQENGGITHFTIGTAGIDLDDADYYDVEWSEYRDEIDWGFGLFEVNSTTLVAQFVTNQIGVVDSVVLTKN